ncbi:hypothetical protein VPH35_042990 [Triticum aestivum]
MRVRRTGVYPKPSMWLGWGLRGGELVKGPNGVEFGDLSEQGIWFKESPTYSELIGAVYKKFGLEPTTHIVRAQGRANVGGGAHRHFIMVPIDDDMSWSNYVKAVFNGTDWNCLEVYVQAEKRPSMEPVSSEPQRSWTREQSPRAGGFDFFLSNKRNDSPSSRKEPESASESESDMKSEDGEDDGFAYTLHQRVLELEDDLNAANRKLLDANEKLEVFEKKSLRCRCDYKENGNGADQATKITHTEGDLTLIREKLQYSQVEIDSLKRRLEDAATLSEEHSRLLEQNKELESEIVNLKEEMASARLYFDDKLSESKAEISKYIQELTAVYKKLLRERLTNRAQMGKLQETIRIAGHELEKVSEEKSLVEDHVKELEEANAEAERRRQELIHAAEMLLEDKFRHEAEILTMQQSIEDLKPKFVSIAREKSLLKLWFADLEVVVDRGRSVVVE